MPHPYLLQNPAAVPTPALLFYPEFIRANLACMIAHAGGAERLRPHVKTHKTREIVAMQVAAGVTKHKVATIAEAELVASAGGTDVLVAYPLVGPHPDRLATLAARFPAAQFAALVDSDLTAELLSSAATRHGMTLGFYLDLDVGMGRTGLPAGPAARELYRATARRPGLRAAGLHAYDGHNRQENAADRRAAANAGLAPVLALRTELEAAGVPVPTLIAGGTPTFPMYADQHAIPGLECSPGTCVLHDQGYGSRFPDFTGLTCAALVLTRVVSRPGSDRVTFDVGHKAIAADPPLTARVHLLDAPPHTPVMHSEEHYVIETPDAEQYSVGDVAYAIPGHVCPTCALHEHALIVEGGVVTGRWEIAARRRQLTV